MFKNSTNLDSIIPEIPTYVNQNLHTGLESTICGSLAGIHTSEMCVSFSATRESPDNSENLDNNNNSLYSILSSSFGLQYNDATSQDPGSPLSPTEDKEISDLWLNEAPTNTIETDLCNEVSTNTIATDLPIIAPENSILQNPNDPFVLPEIHNNLNHFLYNPTDNAIWNRKFHNTAMLPANPHQDETFGNNFYNSSTFLNPLDQLSW